MMEKDKAHPEAENKDAQQNQNSSQSQETPEQPGNKEEKKPEVNEEAQAPDESSQEQQEPKQEKSAETTEPSEPEEKKPVQATEPSEPQKEEPVQSTETSEPREEKTVESKAAEKELQDESDLKDRDDEEHDEEHDEEEDYSKYSKEQLVDLIKELAKNDDVIKAERIAREIRPFYDEYFEKEKEQALKKFKEEGGDEADFDYHPSELDNRFEANYKLVRDRKITYQKSQEQRKEENLKKKEEILERLREFVDSDEANFSFDKFKEIQAEWKSVGPIPQSYAKTLWANWNALVDRFYDNRSIYFELKELDRKKNLEAKLALCEKAENLKDHENLKEAIKELNELHHDFKHVGPVPKEEQEKVWQRFKTASDAVYARRKEYVESLKGELTKNEQVKRELGDKVQEFANFDSDRIKEWNTKTKQILEIQKQWEATGGLPRSTAKEVNKHFWNAFKKFFQNKSAFFKRLDVQREENLKKKEELVKEAEELKESTDWHETAEKLKGLQRRWKEIGPVPEKVRDQVYHKFKAACDHFFEQKRATVGGIEKDYQENLEKKEKILDQIEKLAEEGEQDAEKLKELQGQYDEIGFVPKRDVGRIKNRYTEVVDKFIKQLKNVDQEDRDKLKLESQLVKMKQGPNADQKLYKKEITIKKQISHVENEIATYKNNIEFFASSKKADKLKQEFEDKIKEANDQLKILKAQLKIVRSA